MFDAVSVSGCRRGLSRLRRRRFGHASCIVGTSAHIAGLGFLSGHHGGGGCEENL